MPKPWNVIFSKQSGWPKASSIVMEPVPAMRLHTNSCHGLSFVPWVEFASVCEAPAMRHSDPEEAPPEAEAISQEADSPAINPATDPPAINPATDPPAINPATDPPVIHEEQATCCAGMGATLNIARGFPPPQEAVECDEAEEREANRCGHRRRKVSYADKSLNASARGLLIFKKWWYLRKVGVSVKGELLHGIPIFIRRNTLRIVGKTHSYIIPMDKVDYIRTCDGLCSIESEFEGCVMEESPAL